ncbi:hypothetical protein C8J57DRAFT_1503532 [Mycena rebaudengoi]|nr:hypothetical protein C8J57DRAFT_1503532 [Mycena rebaudengoi]
MRRAQAPHSSPATSLVPIGAIAAYPRAIRPTIRISALAQRRMLRIGPPPPRCAASRYNCRYVLLRISSPCPRIVPSLLFSSPPPSPLFLVHSSSRHSVHPHTLSAPRTSANRSFLPLSSSFLFAFVCRSRSRANARSGAGTLSEPLHKLVPEPSHKPVRAFHPWLLRYIAAEATRAPTRPCSGRRCHLAPSATDERPRPDRVGSQFLLTRTSSSQAPFVCSSPVSRLRAFGDTCAWAYARRTCNHPARGFLLLLPGVANEHLLDVLRHPHVTALGLSSTRTPRGSIAGPTRWSDCSPRARIALMSGKYYLTSSRSSSSNLPPPRSPRHDPPATIPSPPFPPSRSLFHRPPFLLVHPPSLLVVLPR